MTQYKEKKKNLSEYEELKQKRQQGLVKQLEQYLLILKVQTASKTTKNGIYDQIDQKVCIKDRKRYFDNFLIKILPQVSQHIYGYEQCMTECQKNTISYVVANQSCRGVFQKNFIKTTQSISKRLQEQGII